jgi:type IV pilus assembly protein PilZ
MPEAEVDEKDDDRRGQGRAPITLRVEYKRINTFFADYTKNISKGGTFIRTGRPLELGTEFMFVLSLPEAVQLELKGVVKWIVPELGATEEKPAGMGIQFVFADDAQRLAVEAVVAGMMHEALGPVLANKLLRST